MPNLDLDAIEARAERATKGPWTWGEDAKGVYTQDGRQIAALPREMFLGSLAKISNLIFIRSSRTDVPDLVARVRELEAENVALRSKLSLFEVVADRAKDILSAQVLSEDVQSVSVPETLTYVLSSALSAIDASVQSSSLDNMDDDNAALRLAATELYDFVTIDCGIESHGVDAIYRMANVLGLKTQGEGEE